MGKQRVRIGLVFDYNENWIGGTYYILNMIHAMNKLEDSKKPTLVIFSKKKAYYEKAKKTNYPYLESQIMPENSKLVNRINMVSQFTLGRNLLGNKIDDANVDVVFPYDSTMRFKNDGVKKIYWIPDFQELHLPELFLKRHLLLRKWTCNRIMGNKNHNLILSSESAFNDVKEFFPDYKTSVDVLPFAVTHPEYKSLDIEELRKKYDLPDKYFFSPNQFWVHKNQIVILKAIARLKDKYPNIVVAFTGKEYDNRNPGYFKGLKDFISKEGIEKNIKFLGFIDRDDQLKLMSCAEAVIQPSLFEGWSTVVEDAKAMNQNMIASNLDVHNEQLLDTASFFDPKNEKELEEKMIYHWENNLQKPDYRYSNRVKDFGEKFVNIVQKVI